MPAQKSANASRGSGWRRASSSRTATSRVARRVLAARPGLDGRDALLRVRAAVVDEVVERAEDEVEQVDVLAHGPRQQPAGERERPRDAVRGRARLATRPPAPARAGGGCARCALTPHASAARAAAAVGGHQPGGDLGAEQHAGHARRRGASRRRRGRGPASAPVAVGRGGSRPTGAASARRRTRSPRPRRGRARSPAASSGARRARAASQPARARTSLSRSATQRVAQPVRRRAPSRSRRAGWAPAAARRASRRPGAAIAASVRAGAWT